tara:strand:+ start:933 stop:1559 length:627 start_codon:yes stop_codon:yes gene_type:complete
MTETFKYQNSCIYRIYCKDTNIKFSYIGSTTNIVKRKICHKSSCNNIKSKKYNLKVYKIIRENGGYDNWNFEILETIPCNKYNELIKYEKLYYEKYNSNLNTRYPGRTDKEYHNFYKNKIKEWCENNKQKISQKNKKYREKNKQKISQQKKEHYKKNKEKILQRNKEHRGKNKVKINCIFCNGLIGKENMKRHQKTKYCMKIQELIKK